MSKVSIICRTYNQENWIAQAISSALNQTYKDFELIVIDDASTDKTSEQIKEFSDPRIRYIRNIKNLGALGSLNLGIAEARGEYICILDGDDEFLSEKLAKQVAFLDANPDYGAVFSWINTIGDKSNKSVAKNCEIFEKMLNKPNRTKAQMFRECFGSTTFLAFPSEMFRKEFGFHWPQHILGLSETNFHFSMLLKTNIKVLEEPLVNYRVMPNYTDKWASETSLQSELFFILDRFLEIKSPELFEEIFKDDMIGMDVKIEEDLLPYLLTRIAEKHPEKSQWANYNLHRFLSNENNFKILETKLNLNYAKIIGLKNSNFDNLFTAEKKKILQKLKKCKKTNKILLATAIIMFIFSLTILLIRYI